MKVNFRQLLTTCVNQIGLTLPHFREVSGAVRIARARNSHDRILPRKQAKNPPKKKMDAGVAPIFVWFLNVEADQ